MVHTAAFSTFDIYTLTNMFAIGTGVLGIIASISHQLKLGGRNGAIGAQGGCLGASTIPVIVKKTIAAIAEPSSVCAT